jgi:raffinose/stachyose/melibiose transport system substrate-binding protein
MEKRTRAYTPFAAAMGLGLAVALSITGCTGSGGGATASADWASVDPTTVKGTVTHWEWGDSQDVANQKVKAFNKIYPNVKVNIKAFTYGDYTTALSAALASGSGPDTYDLEPGAMAKQFGPLSEDLTPLLSHVLGSDWRSKESSTAISEMTIDGRLVGAPNAATGAGTIMVNQGLLDQLGLKLPADATNLADLESFCSSVKAKGKQCITIGGKDEWVSQDAFQAIADSIKPGEFTKAIQGKAKWTDPTFVKAFDIWGTMFTDGVFQPGALAAAQYPDAVNAWFRGDAVATVVGTWGATDFVGETNVKNQQGAGVTGTPEPMKTVIARFPGVGGKAVSVFSSVGSGTAINQNSKNKDAAAVWLNWWSLDAKGAQKDSADSLVGIPALKGVTPDVKGLAYPALVKPSLKFISDEMASSTEPRAIPYPDLVTALGNAFQQSASGTGSKSVVEQLESASASITR